MMPEQTSYKNLRQFQRVEIVLPIELQFGTQIILQGQLKDISLKSAFVVLRDSIYFEQNEKFNFVIKRSFENPECVVEGVARISRIAKGEGIAIFFTKMDDKFQAQLKLLIEGK